jgi:hypothetical protein
MRKLLFTLTVLACLGALSACTRARIVSTEGRTVTFSWNAQETTIGRVHALAINWCHRWNAPPALIADRVEGDQHTTTFTCTPRPTLPLTRLF